MTKSTAQQFDMIDKIRTQQQYEGIMKMIEKFIQKATELGGFHMLSQEDDDQLHQLSTLANDYEKKTSVARIIHTFPEYADPKKAGRTEIESGFFC
jgi:pyruvate/2-oxoglutarate dehydrogenase complex dihydrolipoamide dehydrogenase (E3) component